MFPRIPFSVWSGLGLATREILMGMGRQKWSSSYLYFQKMRHCYSSSILLEPARWFSRHKAEEPSPQLFKFSWDSLLQLNSGVRCVFCSMTKGVSFYRIPHLWSWRLGGSERLTQIPIHPCGLQLILALPYFTSFFPFWLPDLLMLGSAPDSEGTAVYKPYKHKEGALKRMI